MSSGANTLPTNDRGPNARLALVPGTLMPITRPVIDSQLDLLADDARRAYRSAFMT